jgi:hypothetical protein
VAVAAPLVGVAAAAGGEDGEVAATVVSSSSSPHAAATVTMASTMAAAHHRERNRGNFMWFLQDVAMPRADIDDGRRRFRSRSRTVPRSGFPNQAAIFSTSRKYDLQGRIFQT